MKKIAIFAAAICCTAAASCTTLTSAYAADADIIKFAHQNIAGSQTCYSGDENMAATQTESNIKVSEDGTVSANLDNCTLFAATYSNDILTNLEAVPFTDGTAKLESPSIGMKLMFWDTDNNMKPFINAYTVDSFSKENEDTIVSVTISGGETEVRESQAEKTLEPFTAEALDENGNTVSGVTWSWSITPEIMAVVDNGVVTINSHATAGSVLTLTATAEKNGTSVSAEIKITITTAGDITYSFNEYQLAKNFDTSDSDFVAVGGDGLAGKVISSGNYSNIAVMSNSDKSGSGYFPYGNGLVSSGYYLFLGAGGNNGSPLFTIDLPEPAASGKYVNIKFAKPYCTNNGSTNRTNSAPDSAKLINIGSTTIDVQAECEYDKWYTRSIQLNSGIDSISVQLGKWAGLAIEYISVTSEPASGEIIIPEDTAGVKVMCLGDSITEGFTVAGAYRNRLCSLIEADGLNEVVDFIGDRSNGTGYDKDHAGHSGYSIANIPAADDCEGKGRQGITEILDACVGVNKPDVVLLMIGTNDILSLYKLDESKSRLETLVNGIKERMSDDGKIYFATIPYIAENAAYNKTGKTQAELNALIDTFNNGVRDIADSDDAIELVDMNSQIALTDLKDGIHPTDSGYTKMGDYWYLSIKDYLTELILK